MKKKNQILLLRLNMIKFIGYSKKNYGGITMNMTVFVIIIILLITVTLVFPSNQGILPEILRPDMIDVDGNHLFVLEGTSIYIYDLKDLKLLMKFGKKGDGPGELKAVPFVPNWLKVLPDSIMTNTFDKIAFFSKDGKFINEKRKVVFPSHLIPVGKNFVYIGTVIEDTTRYETINLCDSELKKMKELYRQRFVQQGDNDIIYMIMDFLNFQVYEDKIFIEESPEGFIIEVFNEEGVKLDKIVKEYKKVNITKKDQDNALEDLSQEPTVRASGGWEKIKNLVQIKFGDFFPAIQDIKVDNNKIYARTFNIVNDKEEYVVMDLKGTTLKKVYLPKVTWSPFWHKVLGVTLYTIKGDKLYYLKANEINEEWELFVEKINL